MSNCAEKLLDKPIFNDIEKFTELVCARVREILKEGQLSSFNGDRTQIIEQLFILLTQRSLTIEEQCQLFEYTFVSLYCDKNGKPQQWKASDILTQPGLLSPDGHYHTNDSADKNQKSCKGWRTYGFRLGSDHEIATLCTKEMTEEAQHWQAHILTLGLSQLPSIGSNKTSSEKNQSTPTIERQPLTQAPTNPDKQTALPFFKPKQSDHVNASPSLNQTTNANNNPTTNDNSQSQIKQLQQQMHQSELEISRLKKQIQQTSSQDEEVIIDGGDQAQIQVKQQTKARAGQGFFDSSQSNDIHQLLEQNQLLVQELMQLKEQFSQLQHTTETLTASTLPWFQKKVTQDSLGRLKQIKFSLATFVQDCYQCKQYLQQSKKKQQIATIDQLLTNAKPDKLEGLYSQLNTLKHTSITGPLKALIDVHHARLERHLDSKAIGQTPKPGFDNLL